MILELHEVNPVVDLRECTWRGSNSQPLDPKSSALSIELRGQLRLRRKTHVILVQTVRIFRSFHRTSSKMAVVAVSVVCTSSRRSSAISTQ